MLYPIKFYPTFKDYIWGGRQLENYNKMLPKGIVAESWEISTHKDGESIVSNGQYRNIPLSELIKKLGQKLMGTAISEKDLEKFPLLVKLIDANDCLSVQVHPNDEYARIHENGEYGKNEMWYIVEAKPGAEIVYGVKTGVTKEAFSKAVKEDSIDSCLNYLEVKAGDSVNIPAGLIHAIGKGILIAEIQQNSNTTYRVFDYNRLDMLGNKRPLHIDKALEVINFDNCNISGKLIGVRTSLTKSSYKDRLVSNPYFTVEVYNIKDEVEEIADGSRFFLYTALMGSGELLYEGGREKIIKGESIFIPASLGKYKITGDLKLIKSYI
ncbi:MAG TPA: type I phosphomannose isomerase catalytic subunit [Clostridiaceae bacterium]